MPKQESNFQEPGPDDPLPENLLLAFHLETNERLRETTPEEIIKDVEELKAALETAILTFGKRCDPEDFAKILESLKGFVEGVFSQANFGDPAEPLSGSRQEALGNCFKKIAEDVRWNVEGAEKKQK